MYQDIFTLRELDIAPITFDRYLNSTPHHPCFNISVLVYVTGQSCSSTDDALSQRGLVRFRNQPRLQTVQRHVYKIATKSNERCW